MTLTVNGHAIHEDGSIVGRTRFRSEAPSLLPLEAPATSSANSWSGHADGVRVLLLVVREVVDRYIGRTGRVCFRPSVDRSRRDARYPAVCAKRALSRARAFPVVPFLATDAVCANHDGGLAWPRHLWLGLNRLGHGLRQCHAWDVLTDRRVSRCGPQVIWRGRRMAGCPSCW